MRLAVIEALGHIGGEDAREALLFLAEAAEDEIREAADRALEEIEAPRRPDGPVDQPPRSSADEEDHADATSSAPMPTLNARRTRSERRKRCTTAPKASQGRQLGSAATHEDQRQRSRLHESAARVMVEERRGGAGADQPRFRVDPLKRRRPDEAERPGLLRCAGAAAAGDLPGEPAQHGRAAPLDGGQDQRVVQDQAAESESHDEHQQSHAADLAEQGRQTAQDSYLRTGRGQQRVARDPAYPPRRPRR